MMKNRSKELAAKAEQEQRRCRNWLLGFMQDDQPKFLTKAELRDAAMRDLKVSKNSFDIAWIMAIEKTGRHDWYEPLRRGDTERRIILLITLTKDMVFPPGGRRNSSLAPPP